MDRRQLLLAVLGTAEGRPFSPAQLQKAIFLIDRNLPGIVDEGSGFQFRPYDYGPFDKTVYDEAEALAQQNLASVERSSPSGYRTYSVTQEGGQVASQIIESLSPEQAIYIRTVSDWVRSLSFAKLVKSIYEAYPDTRVNSIFVD